MYKKTQELFKFSVCTCSNSDRFIFAVRHNVQANIIKLKIKSASIQDIELTDIQVLQNNVASTDSPRQIISQYLAQAFADYTHRQRDPSGILEFVYFGDVNLAMPGDDMFPDFFIDKDAFLHCIKQYFPNCIIIKRILVSADNTILDIAKQQFSKMQPQLTFPIIVDRFLNKSEQDFYTEIHRIDSGVIDAVLKYHRVFRTYASEDNEEDRDSFAPIHFYLTAIQDNLEQLAPFTQGSTHAQRYKDLKLNFNQKSEYFRGLTKESLSAKKSTVMSLVLSFLIPRSLCLTIVAVSQCQGEPVFPRK